MILGPVLGAFLLGTTGYFGAFFINGIAFLLSALSETFIRFPEVVRDEVPLASPGSQFIRTFQEGFTYIWRSVGLRTLIFYATALNFLGAPLLNVVLPYFGKEVLLLKPNSMERFKPHFLWVLVGTLLVGHLTKKFPKESLLTSGSPCRTGRRSAGFFAVPSVFGRRSWKPWRRSLALCC